MSEIDLPAPALRSVTGDQVSGVAPSAAERAREFPLRETIAVAVFAALLIMPPLGRHLIAYSGEARMALLAQDMIERHVLFRARVEGQVYRNKPPLYPWSIALVSLPVGRVTEGTAQVPVAVAAVAAALCTCLLGARLFGRRSGLWAGLILVTSAGFFSHSQALLPDMLVTAFTTAAGYAFWRSVSGPRERLALAGFYLALAFAVFSKGPVGLLPLLAAAVWLWSGRGLPGLAHLLSPSGLVIFAAITLAWLAPFLAAGGKSFGSSVVWGDWLSWYLGLPSPQRVGRFLLDGLMGFLPWTIALPLGLAHAVRARSDPAARWALLSFLVPLTIIVLSRNRQPIYLLPIYPAAAVITAWWADARGAAAGAPARALGWLALLGAIAAVIATPFIPEVRDSVLRVPNILWKALPVGVGVVLLGSLLFWGLRRGRPAIAVYGGALVMAAVLSAGVRINDEAIGLTQDFRVVATALARHAGGADIRLFSASLLLPVDFYVGRQLERMDRVEDLRQYLARPDRPVVLIDRTYWLAFQRDFPSDLRLLERIPIQGQELFIVRRS